MQHRMQTTSFSYGSDNCSANFSSHSTGRELLSAQMLMRKSS